MLKSMLDSNPAMRAMMQNPAFLSQMLNPDVMQVRGAGVFCLHRVLASTCALRVARGTSACLIGTSGPLLYTGRTVHAGRWGLARLGRCDACCARLVVVDNRRAVPQLLCQSGHTL